MRTILIFCILVLFGCTYSKTKTQELSCVIDIDSIKKQIVEYFDADSVIIYTKRLKEESYFPEIRSPIILIYNATTRTLDFKSLPIDHYQRIDNFIEVEDSLTKEGETIAKTFLNDCDLREFNDLIIEFIKKDKSGETRYRFICHYSYIMIKQN